MGSRQGPKNVRWTVDTRGDREHITVVLGVFPVSGIDLWILTRVRGKVPAQLKTFGCPTEAAHLLLKLKVFAESIISETRVKQEHFMLTL